MKYLNFARKQLNSNTGFVLKRCASNFVQINEVGPRDGLQNEKVSVSAKDKIEFIRLLSNSGLPAIEVTSFVSPKWIPQLADSVEVASSIERKPGVRYSALIPNERGFRTAQKSNIKAYGIGVAASETFCRKNWNRSIEEVLQENEKLIKLFKSDNKDAHIRGYISNAMGCAFEGDISPKVFLGITEKLYGMGCSEIAVSDTTGVGTPKKISSLVKEVLKIVPAESVAIHCHDTYAQALPNILACLDLDVRVFDSSTAGLGGCPYAPGATGNVATEDLIYMLHGLGLETGVSLDSIASAANFICGKLNKPSDSKVGKALNSKLSCS